MPQDVEIIAVGSELLKGCPADDNTRYMAEMLARVGVPVARITILPDDAGIIADALARASHRCGVVIVTGGLGPTVDDVTREAAIGALGGGSERREEIYEMIARRFAVFGREPPPGYQDHAVVPRGARVIENRVGAAPGLLIEGEGALLYLLPGVPEEMRAMFESDVLPRLAPLGEGRTLRLRAFGLGESEAEDRLRAALGEKAISSMSIISGIAGVDCYFPPGSWTDGTEALAREALGSFLYAEGEMTMEELCVRRMTDRQLTLSTAESVTGGLLASRIVSVPGASEVFLEGIIAYSNEAKVSRLGVERSMIEKRGAVSAEVCVQMAEGARSHSGSDFALSTTGIAGPGGATEGKPVGHCFVGLAACHASYCVELLLGGGRETVRQRAAANALDLLRLALLGASERLDPLRHRRGKGRNGP